MAEVFVNHAHVYPAAVNAKGTVQRLLELMDACGIDRAVCFPPFPEHLDDPAFNTNQWLLDELHRQPRLVGFGVIDFRRDDLAEQVHRLAGMGYKGLKLHPNFQEFGLLDAKPRKVYEAAQKHDLLCIYHTGVHHSRIKNSHVLLFDEVAWDYPNLRFSLEHIGGMHFYHDALAVLFNHVPPPWEPGKCRVFAGLSSIFCQHNNRFWYLGPDRIREAIAQLGASQCIFGLDFPYNLEMETRIGIQMIQSLGLSQTDVDKILGGNLARELGL